MEVTGWRHRGGRALGPIRLDATEEHDIPPEITVTVRNNFLTVADNGPGLSADVIEDVLNFNLRVSSRDRHVSPSRGAQVALKAILSIPYVLNDARPVTIAVQGRRLTITVGLDRNEQAPTITHTISTPLSVRSGTSIKVPLTVVSDGDFAERFLPILSSYALFNPQPSGAAAPR